MLRQLGQHAGRALYLQSQRLMSTTSARPDLQLYRSLWGVEGVDEKGTRNAILKRLKNEGYVGVESGPFIICTGGVPKWNPDPKDDPAREAFAADLRNHDLKFIAMVHSAGYPVDGRQGVEVHLESLDKQVKVAKDMGAELINVHGVANLEAKYGIPFMMETHRQRLFWSPWQTRDLVVACEKERIPLKLNADLSHWCVGGERIFSDAFDPEFQDILAMVADRALLIHARVGWGQGAQVPDPRVEEYRAELEAHERWWDVILEGMLKRKEPLRLEPEFGPAPYMPVDPTSKKAVSNLWDVNSFIADRQMKRWRGQELTHAQ